MFPCLRQISVFYGLIGFQGIDFCMYWALRDHMLRRVEFWYPYLLYLLFGLIVEHYRWTEVQLPAFRRSWKKYEFIRLDFSRSVKARVPLSLWRGPMPWCVNGFIALLSKFQYAQVFLNSVNIQEKYVALDFLRSEVTSFVALLYSCHNLGLLDEMACLSNLYLRFL